MTTEERVTRKVIALLKLAESSNTNEAEVAAMRASELIRKHKLDEAAIRGAADDSTLKSVILWEGEIVKADLVETTVPYHCGVLARAVEFLFGVKSVLLVPQDHSAAARIEIMGRDMDLLAATTSFGLFSQAIERAYADQVRLTWPLVVANRRDFLSGAAEAIAERCRMHQATREAGEAINRQTERARRDPWKTKTEADPDKAPGPVELVAMDGQRLEREFQERYGDLQSAPKLKREDIDREARAQGIAAGLRVPLGIDKELEK